MSDWQRVKRTLTAKRAMDHQGVTAKPRPRHCARCRRAVIAAIDDCLITVSCEPTPTTTAGELEAVFAGLPTFILIPGRLLFRNARRIRAKHPDEYDVLVGHRCDRPPPPKNPKRTITRKEYAHDAPPPF